MSQNLPTTNFYIDLEKTYYINRIEIDWEWAYAKEYNILTSIDGKNWFKIYGTEFSQGKTEEFHVYELARFIKIECTKRGTPWGFSIEEIVVNGIPSDLSNIEFDNNYNSNIRIYPNPAKSIINVEISDNLPNYNDFHYNLFDIKGTELTAYTTVYSDLGTNKISINISNLSSGKYFLKIGNDVIGFIKE
jgi:F5/8 type C domain.